MPGAALATPYRLLIHDVQSAINLGMILRVAETYAVPVDIWDPRHLFADPERVGWISDFSCGAFQRGAYRLLDAEPSPHEQGGRLVATCLREDAEQLPQFEFRPGDRIAVGNEYDGLPESFIERADTRLYIPMPPTRTPKLPSRDPIDPARRDFVSRDDSPVLSAAMTVGVLCYAGYARELARQTALRNSLVTD